MIYTVTGSYGTGSSVITDLFKEYTDIYCIDRMEIRLLYDPDGISDLEYNLIENPNRHNTSHAIKRFQKMTNMLDHIFFIKRYKKDFGNQFLKITKQFIEDITELSYNASWHYDIYERGKIFYLCDGIYRKCIFFLNKVFSIPIGRATLIPKNEKAFLGINDENKFITSTQKYINKLLSLANVENKKDVIVDQLVPTSNITRYIRYIGDCKVIVVERDPRDLFIISNEFWGNRVIPAYDVEVFCKWYRWTRQLYRNDIKDGVALLIKFEDLIYKYEETVKIVESYFNINETLHKDKFKFFNPEKSIRNTKLWELFPKYESQMNYICENLPEYIYDYSKINKKITRSYLDIF